MTTLAVGLMSGTSADGVSVVVAAFKDKTFDLIGYATHGYPPEIAARIRQGPQLPVAELSRLNMELGEIFAQTTLRILKKHQIDPTKVACIGSHGQTLYHGPRDTTPNTLQVADARVIAERTGITVVSDFRTRDMAAGGEGAPLIPYFDHYFYGSGPIRAFQNIGGIANVAVVGKGVEVPVAFDTGPGNCLMDLAVQIIENGKESHDHGGQRAKHGTLQIQILNRMMLHPYFKKTPPKSTGPELFNEKFLAEHFGDKLKSHPNDVLATLNQLTCISIQESYRNFLFNKYRVTEIVVSGGGVFNKTMIKKLECLFAPIPVKSIEEFGIPPQAKEPLAFAFFGLRRLQNKINHLPSCTGAKRELSLGSLTPA